MIFIKYFSFILFFCEFNAIKTLSLINIYNSSIFSNHLNIL